MWCEDDQVHWSARLPESGFWISNFGYIVYIQDYRTVQRAHCTLVCSSFPRGLPWFRVLPSWIASYLLPPASCLLPLRLPWFRVLPSCSLLQTRFHCKETFVQISFSVHILQKWERKCKQRGWMLKFSSAKLVCCVQRLSCFLELWEIAKPIVCSSWLLFCLKAFLCVCSSIVTKHKIYYYEVRTICN